MTTPPLRRGLVLIAFALAAVALSPAAWAQCSNATLSGPYMSNQSGFLNGLPIAQVNRLVADGIGGATGSGTIVVDGVATEILITGTYSINPDCTGTLGSGILSQNFVVKRDGSQVFFIVTAHPAGAATMSGQAVRLSTR